MFHFWEQIGNKKNKNPATVRCSGVFVTPTGLKISQRVKIYDRSKIGKIVLL